MELKKNEEIFKWKRDLQIIILFVNDLHQPSKFDSELGKTTLEEYSKKHGLKKVQKNLEKFTLNEVAEIYEIIEEIAYVYVKENDLNREFTLTPENLDLFRKELNEIRELSLSNSLNRKPNTAFQKTNRDILRLIVRYLKIFVNSVLCTNINPESVKKMKDRQIGEVMKESQSPNFDYIINNEFSYSRVKQDECRIIICILHDIKIKCCHIEYLIKELCKTHN